MIKNWLFSPKITQRGKKRKWKKTTIIYGEEIQKTKKKLRLITLLSNLLADIFSNKGTDEDSKELDNK